MKVFEGKNVLVTGSTSGIGRATARAFAREGARLFLTGRSKERGRSVLEEIEAEGGEAYFEACDLTDPQGVERLKRETEKRSFFVDILFNNAGVFLTQDLEELSYEDWLSSFKINVDAAMLLTRAFIKDLVGRRGNIVNNASISGLDIFTSGKKNYMYGASKSALIKFSKLCALNYAPKVRVNVICPGIVDTEIFENRDFSRFDGAIPMGYIANPDQIASVVLFLASDAAAYITGAVLPVDGGMSLK